MSLSTFRIIWSVFFYKFMIFVLGFIIKNTFYAFPCFLKTYCFDSSVVCLSRSAALFFSISKIKMVRSAPVAHQMGLYFFIFPLHYISVLERRSGYLTELLQGLNGFMKSSCEGIEPLFRWGNLGYFDS